MKILQLSKHYPPFFGGIESVTYDLTEGLIRKAYRCDVLCSNDTAKEVLEDNGRYKIWRCKSYGKLMSTSIAPSIIFWLRKLRRQYDIIHVHFPDPMNAVALFLCRPKAKIVVHWHSDIVKQKKLFKLYRPLQDWILRRADVIVGTSQRYIDGSEQLNGYKHKTTVIPIGISETRIKVDPDLTTEIKEKYKNKRIVFSLGRLVYYKGFEFLIDAAKYLPDDVVILIGGIGELQLALENRIIEQHLEQKVILLGRVPNDQLGSYFEACDLFCLSSIERSEAFGVVLLEALMLGKPIVATNIPGSGVNWVNVDNETGFNAAVQDAKDLADKICRILEDPLLYQKFSDNCKERYKSLFTESVMTDKIEKLYQSIL